MEAGSIFVTDGYPGLVVLPKMVKTGGANMATPGWWSCQGWLKLVVQIWLPQAGGPTKDLYQLPFKGWLPY